MKYPERLKPTTQLYAMEIKRHLPCEGNESSNDEPKLLRKRISSPEF